MTAVTSTATVERALAKALEALGLVASLNRSGLLWISDGMRRVAVLVRPHGYIDLPAEVLDDACPVVILMSSEPVAHEMDRCPLLLGRTFRLESNRAVAWFAGFFARAAVPDSDRPSFCAVPCVFQKAMQMAVDRLRHDRFGKYTQFGVGRMALHGELRLTSDRQSLKSALCEDRDLLAQSFVDCRFLPGAANPVRECLRNLNELISALEVTLPLDVEAARIGVAMRALESSSHGRSQ